MPFSPTIVQSISGGKDSQAMAVFMKEEFPGQTAFMVHADLGRVEWPGVDQQCLKIAAYEGLDLTTCQWHRGDMLDRWQDRLEKLRGTGKPFWSSPKERYCTSDMKRGPINKILRQHSGIVISVEGIRWQESAGRSLKPSMTIRKGITSKFYENMTVAEAVANFRPDKRLGLNWYPIIDWLVDDVYRACGSSYAELLHRRQLWKSGNQEAALAALDKYPHPWQYHWAYVSGNDRLSCMFCIMGSKSDLRNGARHNPLLLNTMIDMEVDGKATFKNGWSLKELLQPEITTLFTNI